MFTEALIRILDDPAMTSFAIPDRALEGRDSIVLAAANWVNEFEDFAWLANRLEQTDLPVFLIGIGAQSGLDHTIPKVPLGTQRLLKLVSERSTEIGARGQFTCEVLETLGITNVVSTGCPSMLLAGCNGPHFTREASLENVVLHSTRHGFNRADSFQTWLYREAMCNDWDLLLQSEQADIHYVVNKTSDVSTMTKVEHVLQETYGTQDMTAIASYLKRRGLFFTNFKSWIADMGRHSFCVGSRIHGTVASILSGVPSLLIAHDSRTLELAQTMGIPYVISSQLAVRERIPMDKMIDSFNEQKDHLLRYKFYFDRYMGLMRRNKLKTGPF